MKLEQIRKYNIIGIRGLTADENYKIGDYLRKSYQWDYENDISTYNTDNPEELSGACATNTNIDTYFDEDDEIIEKINNTINNFNYIGKKVIIAGNSFEYGMDENEVIIEDAIVIDVIQ